MSEPQTTPEVTETLEEQPIVPSTVNAPEITENPTEVTPEITPEVIEPVEPTPDPADPDYKQKFVDSQREAILLAERNKVKEAQLEQLTKKDTPTDEAMRLVYPDLDSYNEVTKKAFIKQEAQEMRQNQLFAQQQEIINRQKLEDELDTVIESNSKLSGKESEFRKFAKNPKNKGISADVLAKAFLFDIEPAQAPVPKTEALPVGSGGPRGDVSPKKVSIMEAAEIRKTDNNRYMELVKNGMIDDEI